MTKAKRAAIYIRTSSERQGQKASPQEQEKDCRAYCKEHGYTVVKVYRDTQRYRVGNKLVEPSGTRSDRPGLRQMLDDGAARKFDLIVAWREDRLYRSLRPMLDVIDRIEAHKLDIELVKETFDKKMAPIKATIARMELDAKQERTEMGLKARLAQGKPLSFAVRYGYVLKDGEVEINKEEAYWVRKHFEWFANGLSWKEIRDRLIAGNAPQRREKIKIPWQFKCSWNILHSPCYYTGHQVIQWGDETFHMPVPVLIDAETARRVKKRQDNDKANPSHHLKYDYLGLGLVYCKGCQKKMRAVTYLRWTRADGHKSAGGSYICSNYAREYKLPQCTHKIGAKSLDQQLWDKVWAIASNDALFEQGIHEKVEALKANEEEATADLERLEKQLDQLTQERQWVITKGRKQLLSDDELDSQLAMLKVEELQVRDEIADKSLLVGDRAERMLDFVNRFRKDIRGGEKLLTCTPQTPEQAKAQFQFRREIVEQIVKRVDVFQDKSIKVHFEFDLSADRNIKRTPSRRCSKSRCL